MAFLAGTIGKGKMVGKREWESYIKRLKLNTPVIAYKNRKSAKKILKQAITGAVAKRMPKQKFGIMLSGGVDSSLIALVCKKLKGNFICYSVGTENSRDVREAKKAAAKLRLKLRYRLFTDKEAERVIKKAAKVIGKPDAVNIGIASVAIAASRLARKDKIRAFFTGLGSEEIFAGYRRHEMAEDANEECWKGLEAMWGRDLARDNKVAKAEGINFLTPFLDEEVISEAMKMPSKYKISKSCKKIILREAAIEMGLPSQFALRKKLAAQYGSGFDKAIERLARKKGLKRKSEYAASITA